MRERLLDGERAMEEENGSVATEHTEYSVLTDEEIVEQRIEDYADYLDSLDPPPESDEEDA